MSWSNSIRGREINASPLKAEPGLGRLGAKAYIESMIRLFKYWAIRLKLV